MDSATLARFGDDSSSGGGGGGGESGRLLVAGRRLVTEQSANWFGVGVSWYRGLHDFTLDRPKCDRFLAWMDAHGVQWARVFLQFNGYPNPGIGHFVPEEISNYRPSLKDYVAVCADHGKRLELVTYADCQNPGSTFDPDFIKRCNEDVGGAWNLLALSAGNEWRKNGFDPAALERPKALASQTSIGPDHQPYSPWWDISNMAAVRNDDFERHYKDIRDQYMGDNPDADEGKPPQAWPVPIYVNEMIGIGDVNAPGSTTNDPLKCWTYTAGAKLMGGVGVCGHLRTGIVGDVPTPGGLGEQCMDAMVEAGALPLGEFAFDQYERGNSPDQPQNPNLPVLHYDNFNNPGHEQDGSLRTHAMIRGNRAEVIAPGQGKDYVMTAANGWRIETPFKYRDTPSNVAICVR